MERALIEYLANSAWQLPLLAAGAWLLLRIARPEPRAQHWVWMAVLAMAVMLPLRGMVRGHVAAEPVAGGFALAPSQRAVIPIPTASLRPDNAVAQREERWVPLAAEMQNLHLNATAVQCLVWMYLAAVLLGGLRLVWAWLTARRLVEHSREMLLCGRALEIFQRYGRRLGIELPRLRGSSEVLTPAVVGAWKPVLLLPENFLEHTEEEIQAALCHELAHVRRRDTLANLLCQAMALPLVWHPVCYAIQRRIRSTREMACDAMAAEEMRSEIGYAKCLVALARSMAVGYGSAQTEGLGLFDNNTLEERVMRLTKTKMVKSARVRIARAACGAAVMMAAIAMAAMFHVTPTLAQAADSQSSAASSSQSAPDAPAEAPAAPAEQPAIAHRERTIVVKDGDPTGKRKYIHRWKGEDGKSYVIVNGDAQVLTPEAQRRIQKDVEKQMAKMQIELRTIKLPQIQLRMKAVSAQLNSPEFQKQMADIQKQVQKATAQLNSPEFKKQMAEVKILTLPDIRLRIQDAAAQMDSSELEQEMVEVQQAVRNGALQRAKAIQILKDAQAQLEKM